MKSRNEEGQITLFVVISVVGMLILAGLVVDGGFVLAARRRAIDEANGAARAGAQALAVSAYRSTGEVTIDAAAAEQAADAFLEASGHTGLVRVEDDRVSVTLTFDQPTALLHLIGITHVTVRGRGTAQSVRGVSTPESS
jgi:hypothetical protein